MTTPEPESFDDLELTDDWVKGARKHEQSADARVERYTQIQQAHATARPPRSWTPAESGGTSSGPQTWVKVTAIVLIVIAAATVLSMIRAWG